MTVLDLFFRAGQVTGLGLLAIFAVIFVIFAIIKGLGAGLGADKKAPKAKAPKAEEKKEEAPAPAPVEEAPAAASDDSELIAVLAAAISAYCGEPVTKFRVVSFKHIK